MLVPATKLKDAHTAYPLGGVFKTSKGSYVLEQTERDVRTKPEFYTAGLFESSKFKCAFIL